ncbi:hypothetical protein [Sulfitobacter albidus]|uniref:hypothetical protein n=1 Tax=Sulfitobacter albidus TaxID=2829501 RepID=UPI003D68A5C1
MLKYAGTELNKQRHELMMTAGGSDALEWDGPLGNRAGDWLRTKANSIEGVRRKSCCPSSRAACWGCPHEQAGDE